MERKRQRSEGHVHAAAAAEVRDGAAVAGVELRLRGEQLTVGAVERPAGQGVDGGGVVQPGGVGDAADEGDAVHHPRQPRQVLADWTPGTDVAIGLNSPRISAGASGFMSKVSRWLGPP